MMHSAIRGDDSDSNDCSGEQRSHHMCGIAGMLEFGADARANNAELRRMCSVMSHRGPDDEGFFTDGRAGIGMRRLSIVDLAHGHQPLSNEDGSLWIVFNGEI